MEIPEPLESFFDDNGHIYYDRDGGHSCRSLDLSNTTRFFAKVNLISNKLYNPISDDILSKRGGRLSFAEREVNKESFDEYMEYLKTKNPVFYTRANASRR